MHDSARRQDLLSHHPLLFAARTCFDVKAALKVPQLTF